MYEVCAPGVAVIALSGPLSKEGSYWSGGGSTARARMGLAQAVRDESIETIVMKGYSPGGEVDGTQALADDVFAARENSGKKILGHCEDFAASAMYWILSQCQRVTANATAEVGSIGTVAVVDDYSKMFEEAGVETIVKSTGAYKGMFVVGAPIPEEHRENLQERVDALNKFFIDAVARGRGMTAAQVRESADGRVFIAGDAKKRGLIDAVATFEEVVSKAAGEAEAKARRRALRRATLKRELTTLGV